MLWIYILEPVSAPTSTRLTLLGWLMLYTLIKARAAVMLRVSPGVPIVRVNVIALA